jgi:hypothetical protein
VTPLQQVRYVPAAFIPSYGDSCPLVRLDGEVNETDFVYLNPYEPGTAQNVPLERTLTREPTILVLELGLLEPSKENPVRRAGEAMTSGLTAIFGDCGAVVKRERIRTLTELRLTMSTDPLFSEYTHVILIGHGNTAGLAFLDNGAVSGAELASALGCEIGCPERQIISLCCHSAASCIAGELSLAGGVSEVIAPTREFPVLWAPSFVCGYFLKLFRSGMAQDLALAAASGWCDETPMAVWRGGSIVS